MDYDEEIEKFLNAKDEEEQIEIFRDFSVRMAEEQLIREGWIVMTPKGLAIRIPKSKSESLSE